MNERKRLLKTMRKIRIREYQELTSQERLTQVRVPAILALKGVRIGPIFPHTEGPLQGMRGVPRKATKRLFNDEYRRKRRLRNRN